MRTVTGAGPSCARLACADAYRRSPHSGATDSSEYSRRPGIARILFVGCAPYTQRYSEFFGEREYWTIDPVLRRRATAVCVTSSTRCRTLQPCRARVLRFDCLQWSSGWGLNVLSDAGRRFNVCFTHLRSGGDFVLGWNDVAPRNRVLPEHIPALRRFEPVTCGAFQTARFRVDALNRHVFDFYRKPLT